MHHLARSQSERVVWLCEELELPYELKRYEREETGAAPPAYKALHPFGTAPVITDGDFVLGESGAILDYICRKLAGGKLALGPDHPDFAPYLYWFNFANASMVAGMMMDIVAQRLGSPVLSNRTDKAFETANARLGAVPYFAGSEFTAADIMMAYTFTSVSGFVQIDFSPYPNILAYRQRLAERPGFQRARAKAEPGSPLLPQ